MDHSKLFNKLTKRVPIEKTILSYRLAARELGISVKDAKELLAAYLASDTAKERGVAGVYLLSGYLKSDATGSISNGSGVADMEVDGVQSTPPQSSQTGGEGERPEQILTKIMMLVQADELETKSALFSPTPSSHVYALTPARLDSLALLSAGSLSLIRPEIREQKWKAAPELAPAYGGIVHPEGERKTAKGKRKAPPMPAAPAAAPKAGPSGASKAKKEDTAEETKPAKAKAQGKGKEKEPSTSAKNKAKKDDPKSRPIGQLGGLFARKFGGGDDEKSKGKKKADSDDEDEEEDADVKPKKSVPAKRKSTSPAVARKKPAAAPAAKSAPAAQKAAAEIVMDDDDEFGDDWAMDEEALLEAERAAAESAKNKAGKGQASGAATKSGSAAGAGKAETKAERQKRELEEMKASDKMEVDEKKPARASSMSRTSSSSSVNAQSKAANDKKKGSSGGAAQKGIGSFFKKG